MADPGRVLGERVFCYQCNNEWDRAHGGLICPRCEGEFTEILAPETEPDFGLDDIPTPTSSHPHPLPDLRPLLNHNPWADTFGPDPHDNFTTFEFTSGNGGGRVSFSTRTVRTGGLLGPNDHGVPPIFRNLYPPEGFHGGGPPRDPFAHNQPGNLQDLLGMILQSMTTASTRGGMQGDQHAGPHGQNPPLPPFDFLGQLLMPGNIGQHGDMVFSQQAFDRVIEQLMEQNGGSGAPPPASEEAIRSLAKKQVDPEMLGPEGRAECSICMDDVSLGDEVTTLPCNHWFHGDCVTAWLKEHDTCPHCRKPISTPDQPPQASSSRRRRSSRRMSSVSSPIGFGPEASRYNTATMPEGRGEARSPRQAYPARRAESYVERPGPIRHGSHRSSSRRHSARDDDENGGDGAGNRNRHTGGGGVTGWIRDHLPFP